MTITTLPARSRVARSEHPGDRAERGVTETAAAADRLARDPEQGPGLSDGGAAEPSHERVHAGQSVRTGAGKPPAPMIHPHHGFSQRTVLGHRTRRARRPQRAARPDHGGDRRSPAAALQSVDLVPGAGAEGKRVREFTIDARGPEHWEQILRAIGSIRGARVIDYTDRTFAMHRGGKIEQPQQVPAEDPRRPLDGLHAGRRPRLHRDRRRPREGLRVHDQEEHRRGRHRRQRRARPRRHRPRGRDAGDGGQGDAVQGVRRASTPSRSASTRRTRTRSSRP